MRYSSSVFSWSTLRSAFRWSNTHAALVGSYADRERAEMEALYARVNDAHQRSPYADPDAALDFVDEVVAEAWRRAELTPCTLLRGAFLELVWQLLNVDPVFFFMPEPAVYDALSLEDIVILRSFLLTKERVLADPARYEDIWREKIIRLIEGLLGYLPEAAFNEGDGAGEGAFSVLLADICIRPAEVIQRLMATMYDDDIVQAGLFDRVRAQLEHNLAATLGMTTARAAQSGRQPTMPTEATGQGPHDLIATYLAGTPYATLFYTDLPFAIPVALRFEHMHILAGSGHGKTQTTRRIPRRESFYRVGRTYAVQPGRGKAAIGRIRIVNIGIVRNPLEVGIDYANAEGFETVAAWRETWRKLHGKQAGEPALVIEFEVAE